MFVKKSKRHGRGKKFKGKRKSAKKYNQQGR